MDIERLIGKDFWNRERRGDHISIVPRDSDLMLNEEKNVGRGRGGKRLGGLSKKNNKERDIIESQPKGERALRLLGCVGE